jgi:hypothetical protein
MAQRGFPIKLEASPVDQHACLPHPDQGEPAGTYIIPAHVVLRAADGALITRLRLEIVVRPAGCAHCPSVSLRGTAPLEYPALVAQEDGKKVFAHVGLDLEIQIVAGAPKTHGTLSLSYLDQKGAERVEKHELASK